MEILQFLDQTSLTLISLLIFAILGYFSAPIWSYSLLFTLFFAHYAMPIIFWQIFIITNLIFIFPLLRRNFITRFIIKFLNYIKALPKISETEEIALRAGNSWIETELFSGKPNFHNIFSQPYAKLTKQEQSFLNNQANHLCEMTDDWQVFQDRDLSPEIWQYLKEEKFFGMIIPKKYQGLGFSALAHSTIVAKIASRSQILAITVMVPNSLGPAELLLNYGTEKQKEHYLPKLAIGEEIPCFGLTEANAGSDATSLQAEGIVFLDKDKQIKIRLNFAKRYITLGAVATVIGLAFKIKDPQKLLKRGVDLGISCALISRKTKGITIDSRHDPLNVPFVNSPVIGKNVVISLDDIIGGKEQIGQGWKMLMECLAVGRGISLPATSTGGAELVTKVVSSYSLIRKQFGISIGKFEGIQAPMAEIAAFTYMLQAARVFTASAIDNGYKPAVTNAMAKYHFTEKFREIINHGMDILGGAAICRGPKNLLAHPYMGTPIAITVEGANIMTRSLIHFGQGAIRCHPYLYDEMKALMENDLNRFDHNFFKHIKHLVRNIFRSIILSITRGRAHYSKQSGLVKRYEQKISWASSSFAVYADLAFLLYGGNIKRKEHLNGRFGDILSGLYLASSIMRRFIAEGQKKQDEDYFKWSMQYCLTMIQDGFDGLYKNLSNNIFGKFIRFVGGFYNNLNPIASYPSDRLTNKVATSLIDNSPQRQSLFENVFISKQKDDQLAKLHKCYDDSLIADKLLKKINKSLKNPKVTMLELIKMALDKALIDKDQAKFLQDFYNLQQDIIAVDSFKIKEYLK
jgi:acyl-CoA dehydrogenase